MFFNEVPTKLGSGRIDESGDWPEIENMKDTESKENSRFKCETCGKTFSSKSNLGKHVK